MMNVFDNHLACAYVSACHCALVAASTPSLVELTILVDLTGNAGGIEKILDAYM